MFFGYCFISVNDEYLPKVHLSTLKEAFSYVKLQHHIFPEIRIVDCDDFCVMRVLNHVLYVPQEDGTFAWFNFNSGEKGIITREELDTVSAKGRE